MNPAERIAKHKADRVRWSTAQVLDGLAALAPLPDEGDPSWQEDDPWDRTYELIALSELVAERRLAEGIGLVLDRMAYGDPGETMRGMRHALEATVNPEWSRLAEICLSRCRSPRPGTRCWAITELGVIRDAAAAPALLEGLLDPKFHVAAAACQALVMIAQTNPAIRPTVLTALRAPVERKAELAADVEAAIAQIAEMDPPGASTTPAKSASRK